VLPVLLRRLDAGGVRVTELGLRRPSLDEAFLALVGRPAKADPDSDGSAS
jgi:hypothetical protein